MSRADDVRPRAAESAWLIRRLLLPLFLVLATTLSGCVWIETHEAGDGAYDAVETSNATYDTVSETPNYDGVAEGKAHFDGNTSAPSYARGVYRRDPAYGREGYYGAAFYFPEGTFTGSAPKQQGRIDLMGWSNAAGEYGGISVDPSDHRARLVRGRATGPPQQIGGSIGLREGCWNWVTVHQKLSDKPAANAQHGLSEVYLNGRKLVSSQDPNAFGEPASSYRFGLVSVDSGAQTTPIDVYVDDAYISNNTLLPPRATACRPNILFIISDDQRAGTLDLTDPSSGGPWMPHTLQWLQGQSDGDGNPTSTEFTNAFDTTPWCCPARASIMTGKYSHNTGVYTNNSGPALDQSTTIQHYFKAENPPYYTGIFGKFLNNWVANGGNPPQNPPDFDEWAIYDNGAHSATSPPVSCPQVGAGLNCVNDGGGLVQAPVGQYETDYLGDKATDFITRRADDRNTPWYLYLAPTIPHSPFQPEAKYANIPVPDPQINASNSPEADVTDKPPYVQRNKTQAEAFLRSDSSTYPGGASCPGVSADGLAGWSECILQKIRPAQLRMQKSLDDMVDRVFSVLQQTNQLDDTLVFFISDNGVMWNEHALVDKPHPYYDMQVPMFMRWTNGHVRDTTDSSFAANIDMMPTAMAAARAPIPATVDGRDLLAPDRTLRDTLLLERVPPWASLIKPGIQYTEWYGSGGYLMWTSQYPVKADSPPGSPVLEYYDRTTDPLELTNLLHDDNTADDPAISALQQETASARLCAGHGDVAGKPACP